MSRDAVVARLNRPAQRQVVECPHCGEPTLPNLLDDGSVVCSCAAERPLAPPPTPPK